MVLRLVCWGVDMGAGAAKVAPEALEIMSELLKAAEDVRPAAGADWKSSKSSRRWRRVRPPAGRLQIDLLQHMG